MDKLLEGYGILCTAVHSREREEMARQVELWGGEFLSTFSVRDPPHLVITRSVRSPKYRALLRAHPHTPAVTPEWLSSCAQAGPCRRCPLPVHACCCWTALAAAAAVMQRVTHRSLSSLGEQQLPGGMQGRCRLCQPPNTAACLPRPQAGRLLPYDSFRVGAVHGLVVCFSGLSAGKKAALAASVCHAGGQHSPALDKRCTHLVTNATDSDKYRWAG